MKLENRVAIISGAGQNIGRATALRFSQEGAAVVVADKHQDRADRTVGEIQGLGGTALAVQCDVSQPEQVNRVVEHCLQKYHKVDVLVNNVGVRNWAPFLEMTPEQWDTELRINLYGAFYFCKAVLPSMVEQGSGSVINLTGSVTRNPRPVHKIHGHVSKSAKLALTWGLAGEFGPFGIRVNAVAPSNVLTERHHTDWYPEEDFPGWAKSGDWSSDIDENAVETRAQHVPLRRLGAPEDIANAMLFLASDDASFITGQTLFVNGGTTMSGG